MEKRFMSLQNNPRSKKIAVIGIAVGVIAAVWFVALDREKEPEVVGCVGETRTFVCGDTITESCTFNGDIYSTETVGFTIGADNITIDGNGYHLIGPGEQSGEEAIHCEGHQGIVIKNLGIDYYFGVFFQNVIGSEVSNCDISYDYGSGIWLWSSSGNELVGNDIGPGGGGHGILLWDSSDNTIKENDIQTLLGGGVFVEESSHDNRIENNLICGNRRGDIVVDASSLRNTGSSNTLDTSENFFSEGNSPCPEQSPAEGGED
jgi:parallel beta-helix repeat protein